MSKVKFWLLLYLVKLLMIRAMVYYQFRQTKRYLFKKGGILDKAKILVKKGCSDNDVL